MLGQLDVDAVHEALKAQCRLTWKNDGLRQIQVDIADKAEEALVTHLPGPPAPLVAQEHDVCGLVGPVGSRQQPYAHADEDKRPDVIPDVDLQ